MHEGWRIESSNEFNSGAKITGVSAESTDRAVAKCLWHGLSSTRQKGIYMDLSHFLKTHSIHLHPIPLPLMTFFFASNTLPGGKRMVSG